MKNRIPKSKNNISITQDIIKLLSNTLTDALLWISDRKKT